jgi:putative ABC transport system permease protein
MPWSTVVGVVADVRLPGVRGNRDELQVYSLPLRQIPTGAYLVRTSLAPDAIVPTLRRVIMATDSRLRVGTATTGDAAVRDMLAPARFSMALLGAFAAVALTLATVGLYGVISYGVTQRTREIGIRVALGASPSAVTGLVLGDGFRVIAGGVVVGLAAAAATSRLLGSMLYGISPADPPTYSAIAVLVAAVALFASYVPARRALRIDPLEALRAD